MTRLRMKESTLSPSEEAVLQASRRASKRSHTHKRRRTDRSESLTPPRSSRPSTSKHTLDDVDDFDQSSLPPEQAYKRTCSDEEDEDERRFQDSLRSAETDDQGIGYYEQLLYDRELTRNAAAFRYGSSVRAAMGRPEQGGTAVMDEEEYAEYIRAGMWRRQNKEEIERRERLEKERRVKEEREKAEKERLGKLEKERIRKMEERAKRRNRQLEKDQREDYAAKWTTITSKGGSERSIKFSDVPWPIFPHVPFPPLSWPATSDITPDAIDAFLLSHLDDKDKEARRGALRTAVLAYHPDRFDRLTARIEDEATRERTRELGLRLSQTLNDMLKKGGGG